MQTLQEYLFESGILETGDPEAIAQAKKQYRRMYLREKQRQYRANHRQLTISLTLKDAQAFERNAQTHGMKLATYMKASAYAYANQGFILPDNKEVQKLELLLRRIGNNVNQLTRFTHRADLSYQEALRAIQDQINRLEAELSTHLRQPADLETAIRKELQRNPGFFHRLVHIVQHRVHQDAPT